MTIETKARIALIGYGNIAHSLLKGLLAAGFNGADIRISDSTPSKFKEIKQQSKEIQTFASNLSAIKDTSIVILCVKPDVSQTVCVEIKDTLMRQPVLLVSVAAGVSLNLLQRWTSKTQPIIRCMPNTPSSVGCGMSALYANRCVVNEHKKLVEAIFATVGSTIWLENEKEMHIVTALSGSGPAYFFRLTEAFEKAANKLACPPELARKLAIETLYGAAALAIKSRFDLATLREQITSKGGTTERGLQVLEQMDIDQIARSVLEAATERSTEISDQLEHT